MRLTLADGGVHSTLMAGPAMAVVLYTMMGTVREAASWYEENHGGYTMMMDKYMSAPEITASASEERISAGILGVSR